MKYLLVTLCCLCFLFPSCTPDIKGDFTVDVPGGWIKSETQNKYGKVTVLHPDNTYDTTGFTENINIITLKARNLNQYFNQLILAIRDEASFFKEEQRGEVNEPGKKGKWIQYVLSPKNQRNMRFEQKVIILTDKGMHWGIRPQYIFQITCSAKQGGIARMLPQIDSVTHSFHIL